MTESEARAWIKERFGLSRENMLEMLAARIVAEAGRQNLIARSTLDQIWARHVVDSAQLIPLARGAGLGPWLDIGSGAGFPGLVVAILVDRPVLLVEPRRLRAEFLRETAEALGITNVRVAQCRVEAVAEGAVVISARAVSRLSILFAAGQACATTGTLWLLPKGREVNEEVAEARRAWHGTFHVEQSITADDSSIVIAQGVRRR